LFALIVVIMRAADLAAPSELLMMRRPLWQVLFPGDCRCHCLWDYLLASPRVSLI